MHLRGRSTGLPRFALCTKEAILNIATYIPLIMLWVIVFTSIYRDRRATLIRRLMNRKKDKKETAQMKELAEKFVGKECLIYTYNNQIEGTVTEVTDGAVLLTHGNSCEAINMDYIVRIREYPKSKKGKKKSVVLD